MLESQMDYEKFISKAEVKLRVMSQVSEEWEKLTDAQHNLLVDKNPFDKSFDDVLADLKHWLKDINEK